MDWRPSNEAWLWKTVFHFTWLGENDTTDSSSAALSSLKFTKLSEDARHQWGPGRNIVGKFRYKDSSARVISKSVDRWLEKLSAGY